MADRVGLAVLALALLLSACGGDDDPETEEGAAPTIEALTVLTDGRTAALTARVSLTDGEIVELTVDWGDGNRQELAVGRAGEEIGATHAYTEAGKYTVRLEAVSDRGGRAVDAVVTVVEESLAAEAEATESPPPTATSTETSTPTASPTPTPTPTATPNAAPVLETFDLRVSELNVQFKFRASDTDGSVASVSVDWGDGTIESEQAGGSSLEGDAFYEYAEPGDYEIRVVATDDRGATREELFAVSVPNQRPVVANLRILTGIAQPSVTRGVAAEIRDPDGEVVAITVAWGDITEVDRFPGSEIGLGGTFSSPPHVYEESGVYNVVVRAFDDRGAGSVVLPVPVEIVKKIRLTLDSVSLHSLSGCDSFSSENEFFGSYGIAPLETRFFDATLRPGQQKRFTTISHAVGADTPWTVWVELAEDDAGLEGAR